MYLARNVGGGIFTEDTLREQSQGDTRTRVMNPTRDQILEAISNENLILEGARTINQLSEVDQEKLQNYSRILDTRIRVLETYL